MKFKLLKMTRTKFDFSPEPFVLSKQSCFLFVDFNYSGRDLFKELAVFHNLKTLVGDELGAFDGL